LNDNSTLPPHGVGSTQLATKPRQVAPTVRPSSFPPPAPCTRIVVIAGGPGRTEFVSAPDVVGHGVDEIPADDQSPDEAPQNEAATADDAVDDDPTPDLPLDETSAAPSADADTPAVDATVDDGEAQAGVDSEGQPGDGGGAQVGDDFWTGMVTEGSIPTRKVVYGARSTTTTDDDEPETTGWFRSRRRRRR
jgi:hypothetical protein